MLQFLLRPQFSSFVTKRKLPLQLFVMPRVLKLVYRDLALQKRNKHAKMTHHVFTHEFVLEQ